MSWVPRMAGIMQSLRLASPLEQRHQHGQRDAHEDRRRDGQVERKRPAAHDDVAWQAADGHAPPDAAGRPPRQEARTPQGTCRRPRPPSLAAGVRPGRRPRRNSPSRMPPSRARRTRASRCARCCCRIRRGSNPPGAFEGSVAPIRSRHFLMAPSASSTMTMAGPDDMNAVRLGKNGRSRWTA